MHQIDFALDCRYVAARNCANYHQCCTKKKVMMAISISWVSAVANTVPIILGE